VPKALRVCPEIIDIDKIGQNHYSAVIMGVYVCFVRGLKKKTCDNVGGCIF
jgi:hypothetical protein